MGDGLMTSAKFNILLRRSKPKPAGCTLCDVGFFFAAIPDERSWEKHGHIFGLDSETVVLRHTVRQVLGRLLLSGRPKTAGDKILTASKIWDDHLTV